MTDDNLTGDTITFIQNHLPAVEAGAYKLTLTLDVFLPDNQRETIEKKFSFTIAGERFALKPADIQAVFPPAGSLGDHSDVLPHILLNRSTLPWEREISPGYNRAHPGQESPWLALLLFDEAENPKTEIVTVDELWKTLGAFYQQEAGQDGGDQATVIWVSKNLLECILPSASELAYLAHVRQTGEPQDGQEFAVVIANRLPTTGRLSYAHLVSVEGRYNKDGTFNYPNARDGDLIPLVSLYSWRFACQDDQHSFSGLMTQLGTRFQTLRLPKQTNSNPVSQDAETYLAMGCVLLPHTLRNGETTRSWYHGPLIPGENTTPDGEAPSLPIRSSDRLVRYNPTYGMFDVSYAAAWELGRLLTLQSKTVSTDLYLWKRTHALNVQATERELTHLPFDPPDKTQEFPNSLQAWFQRLQRLEGVPFNYLVPDERLLPKETIGFFFVDWLWLECLLDGAFSIGRVTEADHNLEKSLRDNLRADHLSPPSRQEVTGVVLRSDLVAGWPDLQVDGYTGVKKTEEDLGPKDKLARLRMERLSKNILICLFKGVAETFFFHLKPEARHFALTGKGDREKQIKDKNGHTLATVKLKDTNYRVIGFDLQAPNFTSALFASEMITAVKNVILYPPHPNGNGQLSVE